MPSDKLEALSQNFTATRESLHRVAEQVVAPARKPQNEIALKATPGGFGTPVFEHEGEQWQVRVDGGELVVRQGDDERRAGLTTLGAAAELAGTSLIPEGPPAATESLGIDEGDAKCLGAWFALGDAVLGELRAEWLDDGASDVNLWPEHFDIAIDAGDEAAGTKANYGFSPGDEGHAQPYLYVGPWNQEVTGDSWNAEGFKGAELGYEELVASDDPRALALEFCRARRADLGQ